MKQLLFTSFLLLSICFSVSAQWINNLSVHPPQPTTSDQIHIVADVSFPSGSCNQKTLSHSVNGQQILTSAFHCVGMAAFICSDVDSFHLNQLPIGNYVAYFQLEMGMGSVPCSPGIVPGPTDSISFTVTTATGLSLLEQEGFSVYPNPGYNGFTLEYDGYASPLLIVRDIEGRTVRLVDSILNGTYLDLSELSAGTYFLELYNQGTLVARTKWINSKD